MNKIDALLPPLKDSRFYSLPESNAEHLWDAISSRSYPAIYASLRHQTQPLSPQGAYYFCNLALEGNLTRQAIDALLDRCPPLPEFFSFCETTFFPELLTCGLMEKAIYMGRDDILDSFLSRGASPNRQPAASTSPLETALEVLSLSCLERLMRCPELDTAWTPRLLSLWSRPAEDTPLLDFCRQAMAPRFFGPDYSLFAPLPLPRELTADIPAANQNWPLLQSLCMERASIPLPEGKRAIEHFQGFSISFQERKSCAKALDALLSACPGLLRGERACRRLLQCVLWFDPGDADRLRPWVRQIQSRKIAMPAEDWGTLEFTQLLSLWQDRLPNGPQLVLDRRFPLHPILSPRTCSIPFLGCVDAPPPSPESLERILRACPIRGQARRGSLSPLAQNAVFYASPAFLEQLFLPGGLLAGEDPKALLDFCASTEECPRLNRLTVLAHVKQEVDYAL